jgi:hypothetical protein
MPLKYYVNEQMQARTTKGSQGTEDVISSTLHVGRESATPALTDQAT